VTAPWPSSQTKVRGGSPRAGLAPFILF
jgi:hypothetical protein